MRVGKLGRQRGSRLIKTALREQTGIQRAGRVEEGLTEAFDNTLMSQSQRPGLEVSEPFA